MNAPKKPTSEKEKEKVIVRKNNSFQSYPDGTSMFTRKNLPAVIDKTDNLIKWVVANNYKVDDIDFIGGKPASWDEAANS